MMEMQSIEEILDYYTKKVYILKKIKEFEEISYRSGKLIKGKEEIGISEFESPDVLFGFKIFKIEKGNIPIKIDIGEVKVTKDERLCYCICENYIEEFENAFKI